MHLNYFKKTGLLLVILFPLFSCTVVKHNDQAKSSEEEVTFYFEDESFDAASYVKENWETRIVPDIERKARNLKDLLEELKSDPTEASEKYGIRKEETSPYSFIIKGQFEIIEVNRTSSAGIMYIDLEDLSGNAFCAVQIGPVIKKSMIRDALEFIKFGDFSNQIEFANISREINFYVRDNIVNKIDETWKPGMSVDIQGVFTMDEAGSVLITPVMIELLNGESNE